MLNEISIAAFLKRNLPALRWTERLTLLRYVRWHAQRREIALVLDKSETKILGLGIARPVENELMANVPYSVEEQSSLVAVEHVVCKAQTLGLLLKMLKIRFPNCVKIMFSRKQRGGRFKTYDLQQMIKASK